MANNKQKNKNCRYGGNCRYSHDLSASSTDIPLRPSRSRPQPQSQSPDIQASYRAWLRRVPYGDYRGGQFHDDLAAFFQEALRLVNTDDAVMQDVVVKLSSEGGLQRIKELVQRAAQSSQAINKSGLYKSDILPLFTIMSKVEVLDSMVLEPKVALLYNIVYGINGMRAGPLFKFVSEAMAHARQDEALVSLMEGALLVFSKVLDFNTLASIQPDLQDAATSLEKTFLSIASQYDAPLLVACATSLQHIMRRLELNLSIPLKDFKGAKAVPKPTTSFPIELDPPGGRHNNDFSDICKIRILPTIAEIQNSSPEYLPSKDPSQWHIAGIEGLLDRSFRLLREDTVGQLRDAIQCHIADEPNVTSSKSPSSTRTNSYAGGYISGLSTNTRGGFQVLVRFPTPNRQSRVPLKEQREWWKKSQRLQSDALVCLLFSKEHIVFCLVKESPAGVEFEENKELKAMLQGGYTQVSLSLVEATGESLTHIVNGYLEGRRARTLNILEFPNILLASFEPTLKALQNSKQTAQLPFADLLAPADTAGLVKVEPPAYSQQPGFQFDLSPLLVDGALRFSNHVPFDNEDLVKNSTLDRAQAVALINSLSCRLSLIQGPPGTGKSYTGVATLKVLLASKTPLSKLGPILCITYTNHALDQVLEDVLDSEMTSKVIRIGSRSQSEKLKEHNLQSASKLVPRTREEGRQVAIAYTRLEELAKSIENCAVELKRHDSPASVYKYLLKHHPRYFQQLFGEVEEGFQTVQKKNHGRTLLAWLHGNRLVPPASNTTMRQLHSLSKGERSRVHTRWINSIRLALVNELDSLVHEHHNIQDQLRRVHDEVNLRCLRQADIIGVTTSGLARKIEVLQRVKSKVLLCEEAGEVLEAHLLSAFLPDLEHVILIGDHLQLRPQVQNFLELSRESARGKARSLDVSLFERLVKPDNENALRLPFSTLEIQRRMHPSIADLIRNTLYPSLTDVEAVAKYPEVAGMRRRLFWLDHDNYESNVSDELASTSHWNEFEVEMTTAFVMHLIHQGCYRPGDIAVLTPYLGQLHKLRGRLRNTIAINVSDRDKLELAQAGLLDDEQKSPQLVKSNVLESLRAATIDNFQGEEAKVVVISLVRSNPAGKCGFLKTSNRINVLLSRAKHGMYIIGNSKTSSGVRMWADVIRMLKENGNLGQQLELQCPRHPEKVICVKKPDDFTILSPEGGCEEKCIKRRSCGHGCLKKCHSDLMHQAARCLEPCQRPMSGCDHSCPLPCSDTCPKACVTPVIDYERKLPCGHLKQKLLCWETQNLAKVKCHVKVERIVPGCQHPVLVPCHVDTEAKTYQCPASCGEFLPCGHACERTCHRCRTRTEEGKISVDHGPCIRPCGRNFTTCIHVCKSPCHGEAPCMPCKSPCDISCGHSRCQELCSKPCPPCAEENCLSRCPHSSCSLPCGAPCDHVPCSKRCSEQLSCGHQCPSICGEACPGARFCQICCEEDVKTTVVDFIEQLQYHELNLDQTPCIFPKCGHFLTFESMDGSMGLSNHYEMQMVNDVSIPIAIKSSASPFSTKDVKTCPTCRGSVRDLARYGRQVRRALLDEATKRLIVWSNSEFIKLDGDFRDCLPQIKLLEEKVLPIASSPVKTASLTGARESQMRLMSSTFKMYDAEAWKSINQFRSRLVQYYRKVQHSEQPFGKVRNAVDNVRRRTGRDVSFLPDESVLQTKGSIMAASLLLRLDLTLLVTLLSLKQPGYTSTSASAPSISYEAWTTDCQALLDYAIETKRPTQQVEAYIYLAQLSAMQRPRASDEDAEKLRLEGTEYLGKAKTICIAHASETRGLREEIVEVEKMLREYTFYMPVSNEERRAVVQAMATEMRGTGHWYFCENNHPFTIGECGMAMELTRCPDCGAPVGGQNHRSVEGNQHATELEALLGQ